MATLQLPSIAYGIRYEFGIFSQEIRDGWQVEVTDKWLRLGHPWEIARPEITFDVKFGGRTEAREENGQYRVRWIPERVVRGMAYDTPILGYGNNTVNLLRLWKAEAAESFDFQAFNTGDYYRAVLEKIVSDSIARPRLNMFLMGLFGALALVLATVGIYGLLSYSVHNALRKWGSEWHLAHKSPTC
jgi:starch phosphorylase